MIRSASSRLSGGLAGPNAPGGETLAAAPPRAGEVKPSLARIIARAIHTLDLWRQRIRQRRHLLGLDDRLLEDVGLSRTEALREAHKPFWKA